LFDPLSRRIKLSLPHSERTGSYEGINVQPGESEPLMVLMLIVGWAVVLPAVVIGGLLLASSILGRRARRAGIIDVTGFAREIVQLSAATPGGRPASSGRAKRRPVGAAY
jgi:hypothetical protein